MADWSKPVSSDSFSAVLSAINSRLNDALCLASVGTQTNVPVGSFKYDETNKFFGRYNGFSYDTIRLSIAGGGTGASTAAGARTSLGLGTLSIQNSNSVAITGGSVVSTVLSGLVPTANLGGGSATSTAFLRGDQTWAVPVPVQTGSMLIWSTYIAIPAGWIHGDGVAVSRTTYANLFSVFGVYYGIGDGSTTFGIPSWTDVFGGPEGPKGLMIIKT